MALWWRPSSARWLLLPGVTTSGRPLIEQESAKRWTVPRKIKIYEFILLRIGLRLVIIGRGWTFYYVRVYYIRVFDSRIRIPESAMRLWTPVGPPVRLMIVMNYHPFSFAMRTLQLQISRLFFRSVQQNFYSIEVRCVHLELVPARNSRWVTTKSRLGHRCSIPDWNGFIG